MDRFRPRTVPLNPTLLIPTTGPDAGCVVAARSGPGVTARNTRRKGAFGLAAGADLTAVALVQRCVVTSQLEELFILVARHRGIAVSGGGSQRRTRRRPIDPCCARPGALLRELGGRPAPCLTSLSQGGLE